MLISDQREYRTILTGGKCYRLIHKTVTERKGNMSSNQVKLIYFWFYCCDGPRHDVIIVTVNIL